jgi:hypothetical protein
MSENGIQFGEIDDREHYKRQVVSLERKIKTAEKGTKEYKELLIKLNKAKQSYGNS